jgi:hypothetical protein
MKITKDGRLKLTKDERRIGNFVWKNEGEHIKVCDIGSQMVHKVAKHLNVGRLLEMALTEKNDNWLANYAAMTWLYSNVIADKQFFIDINKACTDCVERHKEFYGIKEEISKEEDDEILQESRELYEFTEEVRKEEE